MIKIKDRIFKKADLDLLDSISYPEFEEFTVYTETLFKSSDGVYILETQSQINGEYFKEEIKAGELTESDLQLKREYTIITDEEADNFLEMSVWKV